VSRLGTIKGRSVAFFFLVLLFFAIFCSIGLADSSWKFIVTCDSRGADGGINRRILEELAAEIVRRDVDFVLFPGDLVYGRAFVTTSEFEAQLRGWVDVMKRVYNAGIEVYVCRGNHEIGDVWGYSPRPVLDPNDYYATRWLNVFGNNAYPEQMLPDNGPVGERHMTYSFSHKNAFIVVLDEYAGLDHIAHHKVNQAWLDAQLVSNTNPHIFVTGHEPAFRAQHTDCLDNVPTARDRFWVSLMSAGVRMYFCGHDHFYDHTRIDDGDCDSDNDVHQYIVGTAGATPYEWSSSYDGNNTSYNVEQLYHAEKYGYILVEVDGFNVTVTWMERNYKLLMIPGRYLAKEVWDYTVTPRPIVLWPNGEERLVAGVTNTVVWKTIEGAQMSHVRIEYSLDDGQSWHELGIVDNTGSCEWAVPVVESNQCLVRISNLNNSAVGDMSDAAFTISKCERDLAGDLNGDCYVDLLDFAIFVGDWLQCANPFDSSCEKKE